MRRRIRFQPLLVEQLLQPQIAAVGEPATFLAEVDIHPVPPAGHCFTAGLNPARLAHGPRIAAITLG
ncbi:hypothetical protein GCM10009554_81770 [Kribbella koreensis]|uniref:Uncharacterized protein n=1 Tax=Kribbella koreensis TaxID=57909 RepID=A0ABP4CA32_9ACTN